MKKIYLFPGKLAVSAEPAEITTVLGSCVGVALYDAQNRWGGLNHYLLAQCSAGEEDNPRYGNVAIPQLIEAMEGLGSKRSMLKAKVYGGGKVIGGMEVGVGVGERNIAIAEELLGQYGIPIVERNMGGNKGRRIILNTESFDVQHEFPSDRLGVEVEPDPSGFQKLQFKKDVRVLIVDDSATARTVFQKMFTKQGLTVVGTAADAFEAREMIVKTKPDVLTLDIEMPRMTGVVFLEKLMKHMPMPVVMVSSLGSNGEAAHRALELGAIEFVHKPSQYDPAALRDLAEVVAEKVRAAASATVLKARPKAPPPAQSVSTLGKPHHSSEIRGIVVGGNAGSHESLRTLIRTLAVDTPPVIVVNPTLAPLLESFIDKLRKETSLELRVAQEGERPRTGVIYFVPGGGHMRLAGSAFGTVFEFKKGAPVCGQMPSADVLFESAADSLGEGGVGVLLGGFGTDGVNGLVKIQARGGLTIVENPSNAPYPYAPQKAIAIGVADHILESGDIARLIFESRNKRAA